MRVLIADDLPSMCRLLENYLREIGFVNIVSVNDGDDAVLACRGTPFDYVFLDLGMPRLDGMEALKRMRILSPKANFVIVSGNGTLQNVKQAISLGAKGFVVKPYTKEKIQEVLARFK